MTDPDAPSGLPASARAGLLASSALVAAALALTPAPGFAGPKGGAVKAGQAKITRKGAVTTIRQTSRRVVIDWDNFDIDAGETTRFAQPGRKAIALNRVTGAAPTHIKGALEANGQVWVVNRSGVVLHRNSRVDVGGLLATTSDIGNGDFMAGNYRFDRPGKPGARVINRGDISFAEAGLAALVAPNAANDGRIAGKLGAVIVAGRETFALDVTGEGILALETLGPARGALSAGNSGEIVNPGGYVSISAAEAGAALESIVSLGGAIDAGTLDGRAGLIVSDGARVNVTGTLNAQGGAGRGGEIRLRGGDIELGDAARLDASGAAGGGRVTVGGGLHGDGATARRTVMHAGARIEADATLTGDGGLAVLWSDEDTRFAGTITARGGERGGNGGFVEISSKGFVGFGGGVDLTAAHGATGALLIDPTNIVIQDPGGDDGGGGNGGADIAAGDPPANTVLNTAYVNDLGAGADLRLVATEDITVEAPIAPGADNVSLTLRAGNNLEVNAAIAMTGDLTLEAGRDVFINASAFAQNILEINAGAFFDFNPALIPGASVRVAAASPRIEIEGGAGLIVTTGAAGALITSAAGGDAALLVSGADFVIPNADFANRTTIETADDDITQLAGASIVNAGRLILDAGTGDVTLQNAGNDFATLDGAARDFAALDDTNAMFIRTLDLSGALTLRAAGNIIDTAGDADISVAGATSLTSDSGAVRLNEPVTHDFMGTVTADAAVGVVLHDVNDLRLGNIDTAALTVVAGGNVIDANGAAIHASGAASLTSSGGFVRLNEPQTHTFDGIVSASGDGVRIEADSAIILGAIDATSLTVIADGDITDSAGSVIEASAAATLTSIGGLVAIDRIDAHDFAAALSASGTAVTLSDRNGVTLRDVTSGGALTVTAGGSILDTDGHVVTAPGAVTLTAETAGGGRRDIVLDAGHALGPISATGEDIALVTIGGGDTVLTQIDADDLGADPAAGDAGFDDNLTVLSQQTLRAAIGGAIAVEGDARLQALDRGNDGSVADHVYSPVDLTQGDLLVIGRLSAAGSDIALTSASPLDVEDSYATDSLTVDGGLGVTLNRVFVGVEAAPAGPTVAIDSPSTLTVAAGGAIDARNILAGATTLGGVGTVSGVATALSSDVGIAEFIVEDLTTGAAPAGEVSLETGLVTGVQSIGAGRDLRLVNFTGAGGGPLNLSAVGTLTVSGVRATDLTLSGTSIRTGFLEVTGDLNVTAAATGSIRSISDAALALAVPGPIDVTPPDFPLQSGGGRIVEGASAPGLAPFTRLISVTGTTALSAGVDILLPHTTAGGANGMHNDFTGAVTIANAPTAAIEDANDLLIGGVSGAATLALRAGSHPSETGSLTQSGAISVTGALSALADGDVTLGDLGNGFAVVQAVADNATFGDADGFAIANSRLAGSLSLSAGQTGDIALADIVAGGATSIATSGAITGARLDMAGFAAAAGTSLAIVDLRAGATTLAAGAGTLDLTRFDIGDFSVAASGDVSLAEGAMGVDLSDGASAAESGGALALSNLEIQSGDFAASAISLAGVAVVDDLEMLAAGDLGLGRLDVGGRLAAQSTGGDIATRDAGDDAFFAEQGGDFTVAGPGGANVGVDSAVQLSNPAPDDDGRVIEGVIAVADADIARTALDDALTVGGDALLIAGDVGADTGLRSIAIGPDAGGGGVLIAGGLALRADGAATITETGAGGLQFDMSASVIAAGAPDGVTGFVESGGTELTESAVIVSRDLSVDAQGDLTDAALDAIRVGGETTLVSQGGGILLDNARGALGDTARLHDFGFNGTIAADDIGAVNASALAAGQDIALRERNEIRLGVVNAPNDLTVAALGGIVDEAGSALAVSGQTELSALDNQLDDDISNDVYGRVALTGGDAALAGPVRATGADVAIVNAPALDLRDSYATTSLAAASDGDVALTRVFVGVEDAPAGNEITVETGGALIVASGGGITLQDVVAGETALGGAATAALAPTALDGALSLTNFALGEVATGAASGNVSWINGLMEGPLDFGGGALAVAIENVSFGIDGLGGGVDLTLAADGALVLSGLRVENLAATADSIVTGFLDIGDAMDLTALDGDIVSMGDTALDAARPDGAAIVIAAPDFPGRASDGAGMIADAGVAGQTYDRLVQVRGDAAFNLDAGGDLLLPHGLLTAANPADPADSVHNDFQGAVTVLGAGRVAIEDANDLNLGGVNATGAAAASLTLRSGAALGAGETGNLTQSGAVRVSGVTALLAADTASGAATGDVTLDDDANALGVTQLLAIDAELVDDDGLELASSRLAGDLRLTARDAGGLVTGDLTVSDTVVAGALVAEASGDVTGARLDIGGATVAADGDVRLDDLQASGLVDLAAGGALTLTRFDIAGFDLTSGGAMALTDGAMTGGGATGAVSGGALDLDNLVMDGGGFESAAAMTLAQVESAGDLSLLARGGDIALGPTGVGGAFAAQTLDGAIFTADAAPAPDRDYAIAGANAGAPAQLGFDVASELGNSELRGRIFAEAASEADLPITGRAALGGALTVSGDALFIAGRAGAGSAATAGSLAITRNGGGDHNGFAAGAAVFADGDAALEAAGAIALGRSAGLRPDGTAFVAADGALDVAGELALRSNADNADAAGGAGITQTAAIAVAGRASFITGDHAGGLTRAALGDVTLADAGNAFAAISLLARDAALSSGGDLTIRDARLRADAGGAGGALAVGGGGAPSGGGVTIEHAVAESGVTVDAVGRISLDHLTTEGDLILRARSGDARLGAVTVAGGLAAEADNGAIVTRDTDNVAPPGARAAEIGFDAAAILGAASDARLRETLAADAADAVAGELVGVRGGTALLAATNILMAPESAALGGSTNVFDGGVTADAGAALYVEVAGALQIGADAAPGLLSAAAPAPGVAAEGDARLIATGGEVSTAPGAGYDIGGDLSVEATAGIALSRVRRVAGLEAATRRDQDIRVAGADFSGGASGFGKTVTIESNSDIGLGRVLASSLALVADRDGGGGRAAVSDLAPGDVGFAPARVNGALTDAGGAAKIAAGDATPLTLRPAELRAWDALGSVTAAAGLDIEQKGGGAGAARAVTLDNPDNSFGPAIRLGNIGGDALLTEERGGALPAPVTAELARRPAADPDLLALGLLDVGGDTRILTADQVQVYPDLTLHGDLAIDSAGGDADSSIVFLGKVDGTPGVAPRLDLTAGTGDVVFFERAGVAHPLGAVAVARAGNVLAGARPEGLDDPAAPAAGTRAAPLRIEQGDLDLFADNVGTDEESGALGVATFFIEEATTKEDFFVMNALSVQATGDIRFMVSENAAGFFARALEFYGVDIANRFEYGAVTQPDGTDDKPDRIEIYGALQGNRTRTVGLLPVGPFTPPGDDKYLFNNCEIGNVSSCVTLGPEVITPQIRFIEPPAFELADTNLSELFGAFGNEDLWRLPQSFTTDELGEDDDEEQSQ